MRYDDYPPEIKNILAGEQADFVVEAKRSGPRIKVFRILLFIIIFFSIPGYSFYQNVADPNKPERKFFMMAIVAVPVLTMSAVTVLKAYFRSRKGGWFIGTPERLIVHKNNRSRFIDWHEFSDDVKLVGDSTKADIILRLSDGSADFRRSVANSGGEIIYICEVPDGVTIKALCIRRISENRASNM